MSRQAFANALKQKLELEGTIDGSIRIQVIARAYKLLMKGVDRYTFITSMDKMYHTLGQAGQTAITDINDMTEFKDWKD